MNFLENITFRRTRTSSDSTNVIELNETLDETANSLPDTSIDGNNEEVSRLKEQINKLELQLNIAHKKIESLATENNELKKQSTALINKSSSSKTGSPESSKNEKTCALSKNERGKKGNKRTETAPSAQSPTTNYVIDGVDAKSKIDTEKNTISVSQKIKNPFKRKLHIISNCTYLGALESIENTFREQFNYCHYVSPGSGLREILSNITDKVQNLTIDDYCIIMIGDKDFKSAGDYIELVKLTKESLGTITHTNVIVCCPTYVRGCLIQNYRVETFNSLLYLDIMNNNYAYFFDTNRDLSLEMFSPNTGKVNSQGTKRIFQNIFERLMVDIKSYPIDSVVTDASDNSDFFRL